MIGADGMVRTALVRVTTKGRSGTLCPPIQHLYQLEIRHTQEEEVTQEEAINSESRDDPERVSTTERPRRDAAARAQDRTFAQAISECQDKLAEECTYV